MEFFPKSLIGDQKSKPIIGKKYRIFKRVKGSSRLQKGLFEPDFEKIGNQVFQRDSTTISQDLG